MADCDCVNLEAFAAGLPLMRLVEGFERKVYLGLFKRLSPTTNTETWQQIMVKYCLYCPCPQGQTCTPDSNCCWLPCVAEVYDTLMDASRPVVNFPTLPPFPLPWPGDPLQWVQQLMELKPMSHGVHTGADTPGMR